MKRLFILFVSFSFIGARAQLKSDSEILYEMGLAYWQGVNKDRSPQKAKALLVQSAALSNAKAMNILGDIYSFRAVANKNVDSAVYWYRSAVNLGNSDACFNLGNMYKTGNMIRQDLRQAVDLYARGSVLGSIECKNALAYMCYKGLGTSQDYVKAFNLFRETANAGDDLGMYFVGLCYRNGYGTAVNATAAQSWLQKAAARKNRQAIQELKEDLPENVATVSGYLQSQVEAIKHYDERFKASNLNDYAGTYVGYAIYYDWSGKHISDVQPLVLSVKKNGKHYEGTWKEGSNEPAAIKLSNTGNNFQFSNNSSYVRNNHYSGRKNEVWQFNSAELDLSFVSDSIQLSGYVRFYSPLRREPGKPLQIILKKAIDRTAGNADVQFTVFPNPVTTQATVQLQLSTASRVSFRIYSQGGVIVHTEKEKLLPAGTYTYRISTDKLAASSYYMQVTIDGKPGKTIDFIKQ